CASQITAHKTGGPCDQNAHLKNAGSARKVATVALKEWTRRSRLNTCLNITACHYLTLDRERGERLIIVHKPYAKSHHVAIHPDTANSERIKILRRQDTPERVQV